jgi:hypothetical protein
MSRQERNFLNHETGRDRPPLGLNIPQLCLPRSFTSGRGTHRLERSFKPIFLARTGATEAEWEALERAGNIATSGDFYELTDQGRRAYRRGKIGRYFRATWGRRPRWSAPAGGRGWQLPPRRPGPTAFPQEEQAMTKCKREALAKAREAAALARRREAVEAYKGLLPLVRRLRRRGLSFGRIAAHLNADGHTTRQGKRLHAAQARLILVGAPGRGRHKR